MLEKTPEAGRKILISGGQRCNVLPAGPIDLQRDFTTESSLSALRAVFRCLKLRCAPAPTLPAALGRAWALHVQWKSGMRLCRGLPLADSAAQHLAAALLSGC